MALETETLLDRRRLRRRLTLWRVLAFLAAIVAIAAVGYVGAGAPPFGQTKQIARISIEGLITEDRAQLKMLKRIAEAKHVEGVLVFINSPGGTTTGGEALFEALRNIGAQKPLVAQFGTVAASAAYIAGLATDHIVARGNTITGSVGVIFQWPDVSQLLDKLGVKVNEIKSGPLKATPSPYQPIDEGGKRVAEQMVADSMRWFVSLVASRRSIKTAEVPGLEQGRVYSGREALDHKMIDAIGGEAEALKWLAEKRPSTRGLKVIDWKPKRDVDFGWLKMTMKALEPLLGAQAVEIARTVANDPRLQIMRLDGLVSVWQPAEK
jgi:protease-4